MITVYVHGCAFCGQNSRLIHKVRHYARNTSQMVEVRNSKYSVEFRELHANLLNSYMDKSSDSYEALVVENKTVTLLKEWK